MQFFPKKYVEKFATFSQFFPKKKYFEKFGKKIAKLAIFFTFLLKMLLKLLNFSAYSPEQSLKNNIDFELFVEKIRENVGNF